VWLCEEPLENTLLGSARIMNRFRPTISALGVAAVHGLTRNPSGVSHAQGKESKPLLRFGVVGRSQFALTLTAGLNSGIDRA
jgi:hypothetical protein